MTPTIAIIFALAIAAWALVWWDIERRKHVADARYDTLVNSVDYALRTTSAFNTELVTVQSRLEKVERNPAAMSATKERMDTLEKAWANFRDQAVQELEQMRARTMTLTDVKARRFGQQRPNG